MIIIRVLATALIVGLPALAPAADAFERVGDRKILVFAGRQEVPTIDPSIKYDWSIRMMQQALYDGLVPLTWPNMVARGSKVETSPDLLAVFATPVSTDPDAVAYQYHKGSWGKYYGSHFYENADVWGLIERARSIAKGDDRAPLYADIQKRVTADAPEIFGMLANRRWGMRDWVKGFVFSPVRFTGEVDLYPLQIVAK